MSFLLLWALITVTCYVQGLPLDEIASSSAAEPAAESYAGQVVYDQRQTGKYNIHVSIKDVAIIEVDQNEIAEENYNQEEDYYYDDSDLTIKPIKFTTTTAATTTTTTTTTKGTTTSLPFNFDSTTDNNTTATNAAGNNVSSSSSTSTYSANLLADMAAMQHAKAGTSKPSNLIIMETTIGAAALPHTTAVHARSKDVPIMAVQTTPRSALEHIEYTPPQGDNSPIFKLKVQRAAEATAACRSHQFRDAHGKCRSKRSGSILKKLFSMLVSLPFAGQQQQQQQQQQARAQRQLQQLREQQPPQLAEAPPQLPHHHAVG